MILDKLNLSSKNPIKESGKQIKGIYHPEIIEAINDVITKDIPAPVGIGC